MIKYTETEVTFQEVPDEISLCINISNCPCHCDGCHSSHLAYDIGAELTTERLSFLISSHSGISCVSFMGGDANPKDINGLASFVKTNFKDLKVCWYSGREVLSKDINLNNFDFIKLGPYIKQLGPLNNKGTNQKFYKVKNNQLEDITNKFWSKRYV